MLPFLLPVILHARSESAALRASALMHDLFVGTKMYMQDYMYSPGQAYAARLGSEEGSETGSQVLGRATGGGQGGANRFSR